ALRKGCGEAIVAWSLCCLRQAVRTGPYAAGRPRAGAGWTGRVRSTKCRRGPNRADITTWEVRRSPAVKIRTTTGVEDMAKKVTGFLKLQVPAGAANPSPPIGPALGQRGLNIMEFCKAFNAQTQKIEKNTPIPVIITTYQDRSFTFEMKTPPVSFFLKKAAKLESGSKTPGRDMVGSVTKKQIREIAEQKMKDLNANDIDAAMKMIEGSARSMGLTVQE